ncbi:MAG: hypothetical protein JWO56_3618, partial [Acidobacteria bacterium]|nr:hypothetical protein [Acidobacteriota bacterium]
SRLTSHFTLLGPIRFQLARLIHARRERLGFPAEASLASSSR